MSLKIKFYYFYSKFIFGFIYIVKLGYEVKSLGKINRRVILK